MNAIARGCSQVDSDLSGHVLDAAGLFGEDVDLVRHPLLGINGQVMISGDQASNGADSSPEDHPSTAGQLGTELSCDGRGCWGLGRGCGGRERHLWPWFNVGRLHDVVLTVMRRVEKKHFFLIGNWCKYPRGGSHV